MCAMQNFTQNQSQNQPPPVQPSEPEPQWRFRWAIFVGTPLVVGLFFFLAKNIEASFCFDDLLYKFRVIYKTKFARLASLAVVCLCFILATKLFRKDHEE